MLFEAVISVLSIPIMPYFPEFLRVSLTAGHSTLQGTLYTSLWVLANAGMARDDIRITRTNRFIRTPLSRGKVAEV
jgi:hypothetical protein